MLRNHITEISEVDSGATGGSFACPGNVPLQQQDNLNGDVDTKKDRLFVTLV